MKKEDIDYSVYLVTDHRNTTDEEFLNIIEEANIMRNPAIRIKTINGSEIHLDRRKKIIKLASSK